MRIVIDIPKDAYFNFILLGKKINNVEERQIIRAFENGTPLLEYCDHCAGDKAETEDD